MEVIYLYLFCVDVVEVADDRRALEELGARVRVPEERHLEAALLFHHAVPVRTAARAVRRATNQCVYLGGRARQFDFYAVGTITCGRVSAQSVSRTGRTKGDVS